MLQAPDKGSPEFWAKTQPDRVAVVRGDRSMTYGEWNEQANRVADALSGIGLAAGDRLGMRFRLDFSWFIVQRALQKLGVHQVAVNWKLTPAEAAYIIRDSGAKGLACDDSDPTSWGDLDIGLMITVGQPTDAPGVRLEDLAAEGKPIERFGPLRPNLVLYTSGTTGHPKGVAPMEPGSVPDRDRLVRYMASVGGVPRLPPDPVVLLTMPVHHGAGVGIATNTCRGGGTAVLLDPFHPEQALRLVDRHRVQSWTGVPTMWLRVQSLPEEALARYDLTSLVSLNTGAAPVPFSLKQWIIERVGPDLLSETYGCSEAGMIAFISPEDQLRKPGSSGRPYDGVDIAIVDDDWNHLSVGETGEISANTPVVLKGYLGRDLLGEDTVKDGYYRTGDIGHLDEDGFLFITDRAKDMIVAGGVNIYPAEIEKAIVEHPDVEDCAVIGIPQPDFGEQPLAFVVRKTGHSLAADDLLSFLGGRLASFKKPRLFEFVDSLPTSSVGKVLKTELRKPYWEGLERNV
jgi:long-chain acyl-CoA synthetase